LLWVAATNPAVSMPDIERTKAALLRSPFTVSQDAYYPTETATYAHVLLPAAQWGEKTGTMTNSERVVTLCPKFRNPPGEAKADWEIFAEVGRRLGFAEQFAFKDSVEVRAEFIQLTRGRVCEQTGISYERLQAEGPIQWPCPEKLQGSKLALEGSQGLKVETSTASKPAAHKGSAQQPSNQKRLYTDLRFPTPDGRARFGAYHSRGLAEPPDPNYPYILTTGRLYGHWHTQTRTGRIPKIVQMHPDPFIEIHPRDAEKLGIQDETWIEVRSRRGMARFKAQVTKAIAPGTVFVPMHWGALWADKSEANALTHPESCPDSLQPELKACAVQLSPVSAETPMSSESFQPSLGAWFSPSLSV